MTGTGRSNTAKGTASLWTRTGRSDRREQRFGERDSGRRAQDNDRGTIIGRRSFGKGLVQNQIPFPDGSAVRLTVARYYTPTGRSIQKPYSNGREDYYNELLSRYQHDEMFSADSIHFADSLKYTTESGRVVYGGGGIMPDIFVPVDTTDMTPYFREVAGRSILYKFTLEFSDRHRGQLNKIRSLEELDRFFDRQPNLLNEFVSYAAKAGVAPKPAEIERSKAILLAQLQGLHRPEYGVGGQCVLSRNPGNRQRDCPVDRSARFRRARRIVTGRASIKRTGYRSGSPFCFYRSVPFPISGAGRSRRIGF